MLYMVTGGSSSGKSEYGETLACSLAGENQKNKENRLYYIATMYPYDEECLQRIKRHKAMRKGKGFETIECYENLEEICVQEEATILLECMSNFVANVMFMKKEIHVKQYVMEQISDLNQKVKNVVVVTNEIFSDGTEYGDGTKQYAKNLGEINREMGILAHHVIEVVNTIPIHLK